MKFTSLGRIFWGQDGTVYNGYIFRFNGDGTCKVYKLSDALNNVDGGELTAVSEFTLDIENKPIPHSNAVMFGTEYFCEGDEFPALYTNIYNNYASQPDEMRGTCCVYRIVREGDTFKTELKQLIKLGFVFEKGLWCSEEGDIRPFGNFVIDKDANKYYGFNMMDGIRKTRYFEFNMPSINDGTLDEETGVRTVVIEKEEILSRFDCEYHIILQGATVYKGKIYSVEGGTHSVDYPAVLRIIDPKAQKQELKVFFRDYIDDYEPEFIEFYEDTCYYCDNHGYLYIIEF